MDSQREINQSEEEKEEEEEEDCFSRLPLELAVEILSRLPIRSVIQFRFACQSWNLLSRDLHLAKKLMCESLKSQKMCLIFHSYNDPIQNQLQYVEFSDGGDDEIVTKLNVPFVDFTPKVRVIGSCKGLLCLTDSWVGKSIYIYNPFIGDYSYTMLPKSEKFERKSAEFGFGFHPVTKEYKVIIIAYKHNCRSTSYSKDSSDVYVYNLGSNEWKSIGEAPYRIVEGSPPGVLVSGRLHWLCPLEPYDNNYIDCCVMSFDLANDSFEMLKLDTITPPNRRYHYMNRRYRCDLVALGDCLSITVLHPWGSIRLIDVWVMKEYGKQESWIKMCVLNNRYVSPRKGLDRVICLLKNGDILVQCDGGNLASYNQDTRRFNVFRFQEMPKVFETIPHVESLYPLVQSINLSTCSINQSILNHE